MQNNIKVWICGIVPINGQEENISELIKTFKYFDGAIFVINYINSEECNKNNPTFFLLNQYKKDGKILFTPWIKRHDYAMNVFLKCGLIKNNDYFLAIDSQELPKKEFLENLQSTIKQCIEQDIGGIWWNRPYLIRYQSNMRYENNPHCWPYPLNGNQINIANELKVKYELDGTVHFGDFIYNKKKKENTMLLSGIKYSLYDPPNNQFSMFYQGQQLEEHEQKRQQFCDLLDNLGYSRDLEGLEQFFRKKENLTQQIKDYLNDEFVFRDFYRYKILGHKLEDIMKDRYGYRIDYEKI